MIEFRQELSYNRIMQCLCAAIAGVVLAMGPAKADPPAPNSADASTAGASGSQTSWLHSERRALWIGVVDRIDHKKFERIWQCMQFLGAPMDFTEAVNICAPCVSAAATGNVRSAGLTAQERTCINRRPGRGGSGGQYVGDGKYDAATHPQCSGVNPNGPRGDDDVEEARRNLRNAESALRDATNLLARARRRESEARAAFDSHDNEATRNAHDRAIEATIAAEDIVEWAQRSVLHATLELDQAEREGREDFVDKIIAFIFGRNDPPVDTTGTGSPGAGYEDPRCAGKRQAAAWGAMWSDLCRGEDGRLVDLKECNRRITDGDYARTGGRCWQEPNPADGNNRLVCKEDNARGQNPGGAPGGAGNSGFVDPTPWTRPNRRSAGIGPVPSPVQPFLDSMCAKGRCPDPVPFNNGAARRGSNGSSRSSSATPPAQMQAPCPKGTERRGEACVGTMMPRQAPSGQAQRLRQLGPSPSVRTRLFQQGPQATRGSQRMTSSPNVNLLTHSRPMTFGKLTQTPKAKLGWQKK